MASKLSSHYGKGSAAIDEADLGALAAYLLTPDELIECFRAPSYRPPVLPAVALEFQELTRQRTVDYRAMIKILERDPMIAAQVLRVAQSAAFASQVAVRSLDDGLRRLGVDLLSQIVMEISMRTTVFRIRGYDHAMEQVRKHSTATAYFARAVAHAAKLPTDLAFMCGLFHDIGIAACLLVFSKPAPGSRMPSLDEVWPSVHPIHAEVSELLARLWKLPPEVQAVLAHHHHPRGQTPLASAVFLADAIALDLGLGIDPPVEPHLVDIVRHELGIHDVRYAELMAYAKTVADQIV